MAIIVNIAMGLISLYLSLCLCVWELLLLFFLCDPEGRSQGFANVSQVYPPPPPRARTRARAKPHPRPSLEGKKQRLLLIYFSKLQFNQFVCQKNTIDILS